MKKTFVCPLGVVLLLLFFCFFYLYSYILFESFETNILTGVVFLVVYIPVLFMLSKFYKHYKLKKLITVLNIFCFTFASPYFCSFISYILAEIFLNANHSENIEKITDFITSPFNILYAGGISIIIFLLSPIIPLVFFFKTRKAIENDNTGDGSLC